ncbi:hypothetical protein FBY30_0252 [Arthrobacter sp. SLBN-83]|nr:hypothetical protein FBY30_0252 [Arthrobacter sp. SLBN-83]
MLHRLSDGEHGLKGELNPSEVTCQKPRASAPGQTAPTLLRLAADAPRTTPKLNEHVVTLARAATDPCNNNSDESGYQRYEPGSVICTRCGDTVQPGERWDLSDDDNDRSKYNAPEHANRCNRAPAGREAHQPTS